MKPEQLVDEIMMSLFADTGGFAYNVEDVCCDFIRYLENYVKPGNAYSHLNLDEVWNSSKIIHPYGRQKAMLELGLVKSFNGMSFHPTGDKVISDAGLTVTSYKEKVRSL